jgi:hypothetical protein
MKHVFLDTIPLEIKDDVLYISIKYGTAIHKCPCGCGNEIVTPFDEKFGWVFSYNGKTVSLSPSIGNWNLPCKSHYWIKNDNIIWAKNNQRKKIRKFLWW